MLGRPYRIGTLFGITITVSWSFLLLVGVILLLRGIGGGAGLVAGLVGAALSLTVLFGSVLLHELGHSLVARRLGVWVKEIELHVFGGAAKMVSMPKRPRDEAIIAAAGPAVSFALAALFGAAYLLVGATLAGNFAGSLLASFLGYGAVINLMLGGFNLLPALPMDGGRIFRAALTARYGALRATEIAVTVARVVAVGMGVVALVSGQFFLAAIAVFVWILGTRELRLAQMVHGRQGSGGAFEVLDKDGAVLRSYGGAVSGPARSEAGWYGVPTGFGGPAHVTVERRAVVRGPDGRLWIVTERA